MMAGSGFGQYFAAVELVGLVGIAAKAGVPETRGTAALLSLRLRSNGTAFSDWADSIAFDVGLGKQFRLLR
jgi:hypothetical protein